MYLLRRYPATKSADFRGDAPAASTRQWQPIVVSILTFCSARALSPSDNTANRIDRFINRTCVSTCSLLLFLRCASVWPGVPVTTSLLNASFYRPRQSSSIAIQTAVRVRRTRCHLVSRSSRWDFRNFRKTAERDLEIVTMSRKNISRLTNGNLTNWQEYLTDTQCSVFILLIFHPATNFAEYF